MFFEVRNGSLLPADPAQIETKGKNRYTAFLSLEESGDMLDRMRIDKAYIAEHIEGNVTMLANHNGFDVAYLSELNHKSLSSRPERICICFNKSVALFITKHASGSKKVMDSVVAKNAAISFDRMVSSYFELLTENDATYLDDIEQEILGLENALITSKKRNCVREIISLRKRLMVLKRHYEQLLNVFDELHEKEITLEETSLIYFKVIEKRVDRLYNGVLHLRDYVTQVREAYQAEVDISLNNIMKIFTVITAIFLPLTLIVGWYGMNFSMPEYSWPYAYPVVIVLCIAVVIFSIAYFKKNKWF